MKRAYIVVEGPHDAEFVARLLKPAGFERIQHHEQLDPEWRPLVPTKFPHAGDLLKRVPVPTFLHNDTHSIAVDSALGITEIAARLEGSWAILTANQVRLDGVAVVVDADEGPETAARHAQLCRDLERPTLAALQWPSQPGIVSAGPPRCGVFVLPDNRSPGSLEDLLIEASATTYPGLHASATALIKGVTTAPASLGLNSKDLRYFRKPAGANKATLATVANVLRPGKSIAVAIQDGRWLDSTALRRLPRLTAVQSFLHHLLGLDPPPSSPSAACADPSP